jgi:hypothetical protein
MAKYAFHRDWFLVALKIGERWEKVKRSRQLAVSSQQSAVGRGKFF